MLYLAAMLYLVAMLTGRNNFVFTHALSDFFRLESDKASTHLNSYMLTGAYLHHFHLWEYAVIEYIQ